MTRHPLTQRQARALMDTAYLAAATALLAPWIGLHRRRRTENGA